MNNQIKLLQEEARDKRLKVEEMRNEYKSTAINQQVLVLKECEHQEKVFKDNVDKIVSKQTILIENQWSEESDTKE